MTEPVELGDLRTSWRTGVTDPASEAEADTERLLGCHDAGPTSSREPCRVPAQGYSREWRLDVTSAGGSVGGSREYGATQLARRDVRRLGAQRTGLDGPDERVLLIREAHKNGRSRRAGKNPSSFEASGGGMSEVRVQASSDSASVNPRSSGAGERRGWAFASGGTFECCRGAREGRTGVLTGGRALERGQSGSQPGRGRTHTGRSPANHGTFPGSPMTKGRPRPERLGSWPPGRGVLGASSGATFGA